MKSNTKLALLGLMATGLAFAGPSDNSLIVGTSQEPPSLAGDILNLDSASITQEIQSYTSAPFFQLGMDTELIPVLATEVPTLANKRIKTTTKGKMRTVSISITLKPNLKWSDGKPLTTDDILFYFQIAKAKGMPDLEGFAKRSSVEVKDKRNFTLTISPAYYYDTTVSIASAMYAPKHIMQKAWLEAVAAVKPLDVNKDAEKINEIYTAFFQQFSSQKNINAKKMVYSGAFKVDSWVAGSEIKMSRNPYFPLKPKGKGKYLQSVTYRIISDTNALLIAALGGGVDATASSVGITGDQARSTQAIARAGTKYNIWGVAGAVWEHLEINKFGNQQFVKDLGFDDKRTRQAMLYALNRQSWVKAFFGGAEPVANTWISPTNPHYSTDTNPYNYDPKKASALLGQMGWKKGTDGVLERTVDGKKVRFEFDFTTTAGNAVRERSQQLFIDQWKQVGIVARTANVTPAVMFDSAFTGRGEDGKWQTMMFAFSAPPTENGNLFYYKDANTGQENVPSAASNYSGQNYGNWRNDKFDQLVGDASIEFDAKKRKALFAEAQKIWSDEVPTLPLRFRSNYYIVAKGLNNYVSSTYSGAYGYPGWNAWEIGWESQGVKSKYNQAKYGVEIKK